MSAFDGVAGLQDWQWLQTMLDGEDRRRERHSIGEALKDRRVLLFAVLYFTMVVNVYGLSFWSARWWTRSTA
jgi:hypothetical protein